MKTNQEYKKTALAALNGAWPQAIVATSIVLLLSGVIDAGAWFLGGNLSFIVPSAVYILIMPILVGYINAFSRLCYKSDKGLLDNMKSIAMTDTFNSIAGMLLMSVVTAVYSLALIVPGIIASYALFLTPYLLVDYPELSLADTLRLSRKMMQGHKMRLFKLQLGFIGWGLLNVLTLGIGSLWLFPYMMTTIAAFYQDVKNEYLLNNDYKQLN